jgi:hypothetical protein
LQNSNLIIIYRACSQLNKLPNGIIKQHLLVLHLIDAIIDNLSMHTTVEKKAFAERLRASLADTIPPITTASELARQFSLRYKNGSITPGAVRKWWHGEVIPADDKLEVLAQWLNVPKHWLRYGDAPKNRKGESPSEAATPEEVVLLQRWRGLPAGRRKILMALLADLGK